ncbi:MAG: low molecular weight protein arginine phosphatase [Cyanobacteria bacterium Co-bin13]|nr:low molecular weight protein arginine phosphatase [Cyanobacteria bacterium Co-bin13]
MRILMVCSGNTCRSPLAAALLRSRSAAAGLPLAVESAGTVASAGHPMSLPMEIILQEQGVDCGHQSRRISWELLHWADLILAMTRSHKAILIATAPSIADKVFTLKEYGGDTLYPDIDDPAGTDLPSYRRCAAEIEAGCDRILTKLQTLQKTHP